MRIVITKQREKIERKTPYLSFDSIDVPGSGFSFDCKDHDPANIEDARAKASFDKCVKEVAAGKLRGPFKGSWTSKYVEPAVGLCVCGGDVVLANPLENECEKCHRWYNMCGQEVVDPNSDLGRALRAEDDRFDDGDCA